MTFASGKIALAVCDICGLECKYLDLREPIRDSQPTGLKVCKDCFDPDHPQYKVGDLNITDAISLEDPRPDKPRSDYTDLEEGPSISTLFLNN